MAVLFFFIAFSERKQGTVAVKDIIIKVENVQENYIAIWQHTELKSKGLRLPAPKYYTKKSTLFLDDNEKIYHFCKLVWTFVLEIL